MSDKKTDISDLLYKAKAKKKYIAPIQEVKEKETPPVAPVEIKKEPVKKVIQRKVPPVRDTYQSSGKMGRPTEKDFENVKYVKISARIPEETRDKMRIALYSTLKGKFKTQDEFINAAILKMIR